MDSIYATTSTGHNLYHSHHALNSSDFTDTFGSAVVNHLSLPLQLEILQKDDYLQLKIQDNRTCNLCTPFQHDIRCASLLLDLMSVCQNQAHSKVIQKSFCFSFSQYNRFIIYQSFTMQQNHLSLTL